MTQGGNAISFSMIREGHSDMVMTEQRVEGKGKVHVKQQ